MCLRHIHVVGEHGIAFNVVIVVWLHSMCICVAVTFTSLITFTFTFMRINII